MNFTEKLKSLFQDIEVKTEVQPNVKPEKFMDIVFGDRMFRTDSETLVEGSYIFEVILVDGVESIGKVEDGEYELEDGTKFVVENDTIVSITLPEGESEGEGEPEPQVDTEFQSAVVDSFEKFSKKIETLTKINSDLKDEMIKIKEEFSSKLEEIRNLPGDSGVKMKKTGFQSVKKETDFSQLRELSKYRK